MQANLRLGWPVAQGRRRQRGQALIYGLFMLVAGLASMFFLFNAGQLTREKSKLVGTADAVAYSASIMHARALNFAAYTNRALVADEIAIAQVVSLASWGKYLQEHGRTALELGCTPDTYYMSTTPAWDGLLRYAVTCAALGTATEYDVLEYVNEAIEMAGRGIVAATEASKFALKASQATMMTLLPAARKAVMQEVADANYVGDGAVDVDLLPLRDTFDAFNGGSIMRYYTGDERQRIKDVVETAYRKDGFTPSRSWSDTAIVPEATCLAFGYVRYFHVERWGSTRLIGFDEWRAEDAASYYRWHLETPRFRLPYCAQTEQELGAGDQVASTSSSGSASSADWYYSGIPNFAELSAVALSEEDPRAQFAIRVRRGAKQTRTSDARAEIKTTLRLNAYDGTPAGGDYVGLSASEVFFDRPGPRADGKRELASLFNPYWHAHLVDVPAGVRAAAHALQGVVAP
jgi:Putative Flp pilus-assembly TadE/G-like